MDDYTIQRQYIKLSCQRTTYKEDLKIIILNEQNVKWAHSDTQYQYLCNCLTIEINGDSKQDEEVSLAWIHLNIDEDYMDLYSDYDLYYKHIFAKNLDIKCLAQDVDRWENLDHVKSVYQITKDGA